MSLHQLGQNLRSLVESEGLPAVQTKLGELLESKQLKPEQFSLKELAISLCGYSWYERLNPANASRYSQANLLEAGEGVDVSAFSNITGQILYTKILQGWTESTVIADQLVELVKTQFDGEKFPFLGEITEEGSVVRPGNPYPEAQFGEHWITSPAGDKRGEIVSLTREMVFFDRTGQALKRANGVGARLGTNKKKRIYDVVTGQVNNYSLNGTGYNTYNTSGGWINKQASTALVDFTSIENAYVLKANILSPDTGNPIDIQLKQLIVMPYKAFTARRILNATRVETVYPEFASTSDPAPGNVKTESASPIPDSLQLIVDDLLYQRILANGTSASNAKKWWFIGDFQKAFAYSENWPFQVVQAPPNSIKEFEQDIIVRVKASERGVAWVQEPRQAFFFYES